MLPLVLTQFASVLRGQEVGSCLHDVFLLVLADTCPRERISEEDSEIMMSFLSLVLVQLCNTITCMSVFHTVLYDLLAHPPSHAQMARNHHVLPSQSFPVFPRSPLLLTQIPPLSPILFPWSLPLLATRSCI